MRLLPHILVVFALAGGAYGQCWPGTQDGNCGPSQWYGSADQQVYQFMCKVQCGSSGGSGVYVSTSGANGAVLTAAHVVRSGQPVCTFTGGHAYRAVVVHKDEATDIAVLHIARPRDIYPVRLATATPQPGDHITLIGYGHSPRRGFLARGARFKRAGKSRAVVLGASSHGDSGGAVLDRHGQLVGVISATDPSYSRETYVALYGPVRRFLGLPPRYEYQRQHGLPPYGQAQQKPGPGQQYVPPQLPDTTNLVTRAEYERDKAKLLDVLQRADLLEAKADAVANTASKAAAEAGRNKSLVEALREKLRGDVVALDGKIAGLLDVDDARSLVQQFTAEREKLVEDNAGLRERVRADVAAVRAVAAGHKDELRDLALAAAKERAPSLGLLWTLIGLATGGAGLGGAGLLTAVLRRGAQRVLPAVAERVGEGDSVLAGIASKLDAVLERLNK